MIEVFYLSNTNSGHRAMKWLENDNLQYIDRKITKKIRLKYTKKILALSESGFDDSINSRTKNSRR